MTGDAVARALPGLDLELREDRVVVTLNRPEVRNAIDAAMVTSLHEVCALLEAEPLPMILTGGPQVFAAGADIAELRARRHLEALAGINSGVFDRISRLPMPTVAALSGVALGGGAELAFACDFRIGTASVRLGNPEAQLGILAAAGASWRLAELAGEPVAKEVLLAGRVLDADEAHRLHLLNEVVAPEHLLTTAHAWVDRIMRAAPLALRMTKLAMRAPREAHPMFDNVAQAVLFESDEKEARMAAFLERRDAKEASNPSAR